MALTVTNHGSSTAYNVGYVAELLGIQHPITKNSPTLIELDEVDIPQGSVIASKKHMVGVAKCNEPIRPEDFTRMMEELDVRLYVVGIVLYRDVSKKDRSTKFCLYLEERGASRETEEGTAISMAWGVAPYQNEAT